jgi:hypothetical protein
MGLKNRENEIQLQFFKNGIQIATYPFLFYEDKNTRKFLMDILEGFYPEILQKNYPEGVLL